MTDILMFNNSCVSYRIYFTEYFICKLNLDFLLVFISIFASVSICETDCCFVLVWLGHQDYNGLIKYIGDLALVFYFLERLFVRSYYFSLEFLEKNCP